MSDTTYKSNVGYKPPVELDYHDEMPEIKSVWDNMRDATGKILGQVEEHVVAQCSVAVGVKIDRDELIKALKYDRCQYEKGYADGKRDAADAIEALQAEVAFYKKRVCELCGTCPDDMSDPNNCEIAGHGMWVGVNPLVDSVQCSICGGMLYSKELETPYCPYCGAKMEVQDESAGGV